MAFLDGSWGAFGYVKDTNLSIIYLQKNFFLGSLIGQEVFGYNGCLPLPEGVANWGCTTIDITVAKTETCFCTTDLCNTKENADLHGSAVTLKTCNMMIMSAIMFMMVYFF